MESATNPVRTAPLERENIEFSVAAIRRAHKNAAASKARLSCASWLCSAGRDYATRTSRSEAVDPLLTHRCFGVVNTKTSSDGLGQQTVCSVPNRKLVHNGGARSRCACGRLPFGLEDQPAPAQNHHQPGANKACVTYSDKGVQNQGHVYCPTRTFSIRVREVFSEACITPDTSRCTSGSIRAKDLPHVGRMARLRQSASPTLGSRPRAARSLADAEFDMAKVR